ncbi:C45 family autoproteolytic acyltransferase/hydolase [Actinopolymorpha alba]|uniref:C45 family autoproteolytic acyltransferase/hydolase n=1 Tax=Actinopolymorpha alba TaxID=533267 RepID=UPI0003748E8E|nr:C45 family peptidase [Actinopolymorpha alba]
MTTMHRETVAGGPGAFMTVDHLTVSGSQAAIGRRLAEEARSRYGWRPVPADPVVSRARRAWFERNWPQHYARMAGAAQAMGVDLRDDLVHLDALSGVPDGSGCSATWSAPSATVEGRALLGRNYDFFTVGWRQLFALLGGETPPAHETPMAARPYVITSRPDDGPATTVITMSDLDGCTEGINEHGLAVVLLLADTESTSGSPVDAGPQVGLSSMQLPRFVLDTCENVEQAKQALLGAKQYDLGIPLHYLIADRTGRAFVWEHSNGGVDHIIEADGEALCVTNHPLHRPIDPANPPRDNAETMLTYQRHEHLREQVKDGPMSAARLREVLDEVRFDARKADALPVRTLWRTVFDLDELTMAAHFYLGDAPDGDLVYSPEVTFSPVVQRHRVG